MRSLKLVLIMAVAAAPALFANVCVPDTLANYIALGSTGCSLDGLNATDFSFTDLPGSFKLPASRFFVTPVSTSNVFGFDFTSSEFSVGPNGLLDIQINYFWDPGSIRSAGQVMNDPITPPGLSQITVNGCENSNFIMGVCPTTEFTLVLAATNPSQTTVAATEVFPPNTVTTLGIAENILVEGNNCTPPSGVHTCADIINFGSTVQTAPEPSALLLVLLPAGAGLAFGRRRRRRHLV